MIALDTNLVVRLLVAADDPAQSERAALAVRRADAVFVAKTVLLETAWLLRATFRFPRADIAMALRRLAGLPQVVLEDAPAVHRALGWIDAGMDFADALHLTATPPGATFLTYDRALARRARALPDAPATAAPAA